MREVRESKRLTDSPCCLVNAEGGFSTQMQRLMKMANKDFPETARILEINPSSPLIRRLCRLSANPEHDAFIKQCGLQLWSNAMILEGITPEAEDLVSRVQALHGRGGREAVAADPGLSDSPRAASAPALWRFGQREDDVAASFSLLIVLAGRVVVHVRADAVEQPGIDDGTHLRGGPKSREKRPESTEWLEQLARRAHVAELVLRRVGVRRQPVEQTGSDQLRELLGQAAAVLELPDPQRENLHQGTPADLVPIRLIEVVPQRRKLKRDQGRAGEDLVELVRGNNRPLRVAGRPDLRPLHPVSAIRATPRTRGPLVPPRSWNHRGAGRPCWSAPAPREWSRDRSRACPSCGFRSSVPSAICRISSTSVDRGSFSVFRTICASARIGSAALGMGGSLR